MCCSCLQRVNLRAFARVQFYFSQFTKKENFFVVHIITSKPLPPPPAIVDQFNGWEIARMAMPRVQGLGGKRLVAQAYEGPEKTPLIEFMADRMQLMEQMRSGMDFHRVAGESVAKTIHSAQNMGIDRSALPIDLGGTRSFDLFLDWVQARI